MISTAGGLQELPAFTILRQKSEKPNQRTLYDEAKGIQLAEAASEGLS